jgi:hypothetical protein
MTSIPSFRLQCAYEPVTPTDGATEATPGTCTQGRLLATPAYVEVGRRWTLAGIPGQRGLLLGRPVVAAFLTALLQGSGTRGEPSASVGLPSKSLTRRRTSLLIGQWACSSIARPTFASSS